MQGSCGLPIDSPKARTERNPGELTLRDAIFACPAASSQAPRKGNRVATIFGDLVPRFRMSVYMAATSDTNETHEHTVSGRHHRRRAGRHGAGDRARPARDFMRQRGAAHGAASDSERPGSYAARDGTLLPLG